MSIDVPYGITRRLRATDVTTLRTRLSAALASEGFGVLTEIDMQRTLQAKLGVQIEPYLILGACNPQLAHRALERDASVGLLLPCNAVLTQDGPDVVVSILSPKALFRAIRAREDLSPVADEAERKLRRVVENL